MPSQEALDLRDLAQKIEEVARNHPAWSMVYNIVYTATDHIQALAGVMEARQIKE